MAVDGKWYVTTRHVFSDQGEARRVYEDKQAIVGADGCFSVSLSNTDSEQPPADDALPPHVYTRTTTARAIKWTGDNIAEVAEFLSAAELICWMRVHKAGVLSVMTADKGTACRLDVGQWLVFESELPVVIGDAEFKRIYKR